jgi:hypothetical protein
MASRLRFGLCTDQNLPWPVLVERWRRVEALGFGLALYEPASFLR